MKALRSRAKSASSEGLLDAVAVKTATQELAARKSDKTLNEKASRWAFASGDRTRRRTCFMRPAQAQEGAEGLHQQHKAPPDMLSDQSTWRVCVEKCPHAAETAAGARVATHVLLETSRLRAAREVRGRADSSPKTTARVKRRWRTMECHGGRPMECHEVRRRRTRTSNVANVTDSRCAKQRGRDLLLVKRADRGERAMPTAGKVDETSRRASSWCKRLKSRQSHLRRTCQQACQRVGAGGTTDLEQGCDLDMPVVVQRQAPMAQTVLRGSAVTVHRQRSSKFLS